MKIYSEESEKFQGTSTWVKVDQGEQPLHPLWNTGKLPIWKRKKNVLPKILSSSKFRISQKTLSLKNRTPKGE